MQTLFRTHQEITEQGFEELWDKAVFIFDANVLLDLYRLPDNARKDLLRLLSDKQINSRIWLPFQVSLEFVYNKIDAIVDQKNKYTAVKEIINNSISQIDSIYSDLQKKLTDLQLKKRHSSINPDSFVNEDLFRSSYEILNNFLKELAELDKIQPDVNDVDQIKTKVFEVFRDKIGKPFSKEELNRLYQEGEGRYKDNIPPGYKDKAKDGYYLYEDKKFLRKYGDLVVWKETIKKCTDDNIEYLILVTGDSKEDWWQERRGKKIGPRYELLNEIYFESKSMKLFHMYDTSSFMQYSKKYLNINIKEQSITETKDLLELSKILDSVDLSDAEMLPIRLLLEREVSAYPQLKLRFSNAFPLASHLFVPYQDMHLILSEIFSNAVRYSSEQHISVRLFRNRGYIALRFRNNILPADFHKTQTKGLGIQLIQDVMNQYGHVVIAKNTEYFKIVLYFDEKFSSLNVKIPVGISQ